MSEHPSGPPNDTRPHVESINQLVDASDNRGPTERPHPLTPVAQTWIMFVAAALALLREFMQGSLPDFSRWGVWVWVLLAISIAQIVVGLVSWRYTRFVADEHEFRIESTFISHSSRKIAYDKIQAVDIAQPFAARLLGLAKLHIDAGSGQGENIEFLTKTRAEELRDHLMLRAHGTVAAQLPSAPDEPREEVADNVLVRARPLDLVLVAVLTPSFLFLLAFMIIFLIDVLLGGRLGAAWLVAAPLLGLVWVRVVNQWNFTLSRTPRGLKVTRGLFNLATQSVPPHRVQGIRLTQSLLTRQFGLWKVQVTVLGVGVAETDESAATDILVPAGTWADAEAALQAIWPGQRLDDLRWERQPPPARWLTWFTYRTRGWAWNETVFATRRGLLERKIDVVPYARIQGLGVRQGPLQRALGLASIGLNISPGAVHAQAGHLRAADARVLVLRLAQQGRTARVPGTLVQQRQAVAVTAGQLAQRAPTGFVPAGQPIQQGRTGPTLDADAPASQPGEH